MEHVKGELIRLGDNDSRQGNELGKISSVLPIFKEMLEQLCNNEKEYSKRLNEIPPELLKIGQEVGDINSFLIQIDKEKEKLLRKETERSDMILALLKRLCDNTEHSDINRIISCKSDDDYNRSIIPLNNYFNGSGAAISMHLTSVAEKPDPIVYETADIIRTSALSLIADEIKEAKLDGDAAELGVAQGKFARVINTMFPEKTLHLFDTFEGFPESDIEIDKQMNYSNASKSNYAGISIDEVLKSMRYPEKCVIHKGYFPHTAEGIEKRFCFVSIDCDLYKPIYEGLMYFYPRLVNKGCIFVHDYRSKYYTGVKHALKEFAEKYKISYSVLPDNTGTAVIMK